MRFSSAHEGGRRGAGGDKRREESSEVNSEAEMSVLLNRAIVSVAPWMASSCLLALKGPVLSHPWSGGKVIIFRRDEWN